MKVSIRVAPWTSTAAQRTHGGVVALIVLSAGCLFTPLPVNAQDTRRDGTPLRAEYFLAAGAGAALLSLVDEPVQRLTQELRGPVADRAAHLFRQLGEVHVVLPATLGVLTTGLVSDRKELERAGSQLAVSLVFAAAAVGGGKFIIGRERPGHPDSSDAHRFNPFTGVFEKAFPSGHSAIAFAVATTLADLSASNVTRGFIYAAAAGTAWSRVHDNRHWLSDVATGTLVGIAASRLATGRWTLFGIEVPDYLAAETDERPAAGELFLSAAAGIGIFELARLTGDSMDYRPFLAPLNRGWGLGVSASF